MRNAYLTWMLPEFAFDQIGKKLLNFYIDFIDIIVKISIRNT